MSKVKVSNTFTRQVPEAIRNDYPLFVEFIKAYYEYLNNNYLLKIEDSHSIDKSLDSFLKYFKKEMADRIPIEYANDPRNFLANIKSFYAARGSEESYKFIFRTLFNKEAEILYPSKQILRASDGRWKQDISVFLLVDPTSGTNPDTGQKDLFQLGNGFATITTEEKSFRTYVERVVLYGGTIYETFIQRDYSDEIQVGSTLSATINGVTYKGIVQRCPTKVSVFKPGKGFKPGDTFFLSTSIGRGCEVKVTKVGSEGEIKAIQVLSFGLDYKTRFFSYLSSKTDTAFEYIHPINKHIGPGGVVKYESTSSYTESTEGFIEYGFATKQTYMSYDTMINNSNPLYAQGDYVGEVVSSFYSSVNDDLGTGNEDLAVIEVQLGAIAKYPGYYQSQNGFISDEMYIHDGKYYQAYSYVIKVEEQLDKYADLIKAVLHPAGSKMFAEYDIRTTLLVSYTQPSLFKRISLASTTAVRDDYMQTYENWIYDDGFYRLPDPLLGEPEPQPYIINDTNPDPTKRKHTYQLNMKHADSSVTAQFTKFKPNTNNQDWSYFDSKVFPSLASNQDPLSETVNALSLYAIVGGDRVSDLKTIILAQDRNSISADNWKDSVSTIDNTYSIPGGNRISSLLTIAKPRSSSVTADEPTLPVSGGTRKSIPLFDQKPLSSSTTVTTLNYPIVGGNRHTAFITDFKPASSSVTTVDDTYPIVGGNRISSIFSIAKPRSSSVVATSLYPVVGGNRVSALRTIILAEDRNSISADRWKDSVSITTLNYPIVGGNRHTAFIADFKPASSSITMSDFGYQVTGGERTYSLLDIRLPKTSPVPLADTEVYEMLKPNLSSTTSVVDQNYGISGGNRIKSLLSVEKPFATNNISVTDVRTVLGISIKNAQTTELISLVDTDFYNLAFRMFNSSVTGGDAYPVSGGSRSNALYSFLFDKDNSRWNDSITMSDSKFILPTLIKSSSVTTPDSDSNNIVIASDRTSVSASKWTENVGTASTEVISTAFGTRNSPITAATLNVIIARAMFFPNFELTPGSTAEHVYATSTYAVTGGNRINDLKSIILASDRNSTSANKWKDAVTLSSLISGKQVTLGNDTANRFKSAINSSDTGYVVANSFNDPSEPSYFSAGLPLYQPYTAFA